MFDSLTRPRSAQERLERSSDFELFSWFFMRISGVVLLFIAVFHLMYMHFVVGVTEIDFEVVAQRWENPFWRVFDLFLLAFAFTHGSNGMRIIIEDYAPSQGWRATLKTLLYIVFFSLLLMGAYVILTF